MTGRSLLITWQDHCQVYRVLHSSACSYYENWNARYKIPAIMLTSVGAGLAFSVQIFPSESTLYVPVVVGCLNLLAGTFTSISSFHKTAERSEGHRVASIQFSKLRRKISEKLTLCKNIRDDFVTSIREDLDGLIEAGPEIPDCVVCAFKEENEDLKLQLPAIIDLGGLDVISGHHHGMSKLSSIEIVSKFPSKDEKVEKSNVLNSN